MRVKAYGASIGFMKAQGNMLTGIKKLWALFQKRELGTLECNDYDSALM